MVGAKYDTQGFDRGWRSVHLEFHWDIFTVQLCVRCQNWEPYGHNFHMLTPLIISWHLYWMTVIPVTHSLSLTQPTAHPRAPNKVGKAKSCLAKWKVPTASIYETVTLPEKINEILSSLLNMLTIAAFYFSPNLGKREQFESLWGAVNHMPSAF